MSKHETISSSLPIYFSFKVYKVGLTRVCSKEKVVKARLILSSSGLTFISNLGGKDLENYKEYHYEIFTRCWYP